MLNPLHEVVFAYIKRHYCDFVDAPDDTKMNIDQAREDLAEKIEKNIHDEEFRQLFNYMLTILSHNKHMIISLYSDSDAPLTSRTVVNTNEEDTSDALELHAEEEWPDLQEEEEETYSNKENRIVEEISSEEEVVVDVKDYKKEVERRNRAFSIRPKQRRPLSPVKKEEDIDADWEECLEKKNRQQRRMMYWYRKKNRYNEYKERNMGKFMLKALEGKEKKKEN